MAYAIGQAAPWPVSPDWDQQVQETLAWFTDVQVARTGVQQKRQLRLFPRRAFAFQGTAVGDVRRLLDAMRFDMGVKSWLLPIYPDVQFLSAAIAQGTETIACNTAGLDFVTGGQALLWLDHRTWEVVSVQSIADAQLTFAVGTVNAWGVGTRLYPLRVATLATEFPKEDQASDDAATIQVTLQIQDVCGWTAQLPLATYRTLPVLEWRGDEGQSIETDYDRTVSTVDVNTGPVSYFDVPGMPFRKQPQNFVLAGRDQHDQFRSLVYALAGRAGQLWVPSWQADFSLIAAAASGDQSLQVAWAGYTVFGRQQVNRQDIRIELYGGTVLYRRITGSQELASSELLTLDSVLGVAFTPDQVRQISFLSVMQLASDTVQINHLTDADGVATATLTWQAVNNDL